MCKESAPLICVECKCSSPTQPDLPSWCDSSISSGQVPLEASLEWPAAGRYRLSTNGKQSRGACDQCVAAFGEAEADPGKCNPLRERPGALVSILGRICSFQLNQHLLNIVFELAKGKASTPKRHFYSWASGPDCPP